MTPTTAAIVRHAGANPAIRDTIAQLASYLLLATNYLSYSHPADRQNAALLARLAADRLRFYLHPLLGKQLTTADLYYLLGKLAAGLIAPSPTPNDPAAVCEHLASILQSRLNQLHAFQQGAN